MTNNDILKRYQYALRMNNAHALKIFALANFELDASSLDELHLPEDHKDYVRCDDSTLAHFLDGVIYLKRGKQEGVVHKSESKLNNNLILRKMKIAFAFRDDDMIRLLKLSDLNVSKPELTALFRKEGHKHYRECKDQFLRNFLRGLTTELREKKE